MTRDESIDVFSNFCCLLKLHDCAVASGHEINKHFLHTSDFKFGISGGWFLLLMKRQERYESNDSLYIRSKCGFRISTDWTDRRQPLILFLNLVLSGTLVLLGSIRINIIIEGKLFGISRQDSINLSWLYVYLHFNECFTVYDVLMLIPSLMQHWCLMQTPTYCDISCSRVISSATC